MLVTVDLSSAFHGKQVFSQAKILERSMENT